MRTALTVAIACALTACGGGSSPGQAADTGNVWTDADLTPASVAAPLAAQAVALAEAQFSVGDYVISCNTNTPARIVATSPNDATAQLDSLSWVAFGDLIQDGPPYTCGDNQS